MWRGGAEGQGRHDTGHGETSPPAPGSRECGAHPGRTDPGQAHSYENARQQKNRHVSRRDERQDGDKGGQDRPHGNEKGGPDAAGQAREADGDGSCGETGLNDDE